MTSKHKLQDQEPWQQEVVNDHDAAEENIKDTIALGQSIMDLQQVILKYTKLWNMNIIYTNIFSGLG